MFGKIKSKKGLINEQKLFDKNINISAIYTNVKF